MKSGIGDGKINFLNSYLIVKTYRQLVRDTAVHSLVILIFILPLGFHQPPAIMDALTGKVAEGFSIHVSPIRILLEPLIGPLLFYLRAVRPIAEFASLFVWATVLVLAWNLFQRQSDGNSLRRTFFTWFVRIPLAFGLWTALLLLIIFVPLPSNTIVNRTADRILVNIHAHSYFSHDGLFSQAQQIGWHKRNGFDAFFMTDHNHHSKTLELIEKQNRGKVSQSPAVLCGEEFSGSNHMLLLGLTHDFASRGIAETQLIDSVHAQGGVVIVAHWFERRQNPIAYYVKMGTDGFEIENQNNRGYADSLRIALASACQSNGLLMMGSCDYHGYGSAAYTWNTLTIPEWKTLSLGEKRDAVMEILSSRKSAKTQLLIYRDRRKDSRQLVALSPLFTWVDYFRSLSLLQVGSWLGWIGLGLWMRKMKAIISLRRWLKKKPYRLENLISFISGSWILFIGLFNLSRASSLEGFNEIFLEFGITFSLLGAFFLLYPLALMLAVRYGKRSSDP